MEKSKWRKFIDWLVLSSANPQQASATVQGILGVTATLLLQASPIFHLHIVNDQITFVVNTIMEMFTTGLQIVSLLVIIAGGARKIWLTWIDWKRS